MRTLTVTARLFNDINRFFLQLGFEAESFKTFQNYGRILAVSFAVFNTQCNVIINFILNAKSPQIIKILQFIANNLNCFDISKVFILHYYTLKHTPFGVYSFFMLLCKTEK
jgi:hypothetical protein